MQVRQRDAVEFRAALCQNAGGRRSHRTFGILSDRIFWRPVRSGQDVERVILGLEIRGKIVDAGQLCPLSLRDVRRKHFG